jgi:hypothetical protein
MEEDEGVMWENYFLFPFFSLCIFTYQKFMSCTKHV